MEALNSSPTRSDSGLVSPNTRASTDPPRRGPAHRHAHRRSAAMSSHDLNAALGLNLPKKTTEGYRGSSAPSSPSGPELNKHFSFPLLRPNEVTRQEEKPTPQETTDNVQVEVGVFTAAVVEPVPAVRKSSRVGFSDTLEFIPRPLSLISSDASSTATVRPGHSVSGSISSIISISNSIIMEELAPLEPTPSQSGTGSRPSTAGAILDRTQSQVENDIPQAKPRRRGSLPLLADIPLPASDLASSADPSPTKIPKKWSFFGLDAFAGTSSPSKSRSDSLSSCETSQASNLDSPASEARPETCAINPESSIDKTRKKSKKQKKVKNWAGSILTKRSKDRNGKGKKVARRGPTPPPLRLDVEDEDNVSDSTDTKSEPTMPTVMITELDDQDQGGVDSWKPPRPVTEDDTAFPMIDLDAALGPFNTPLPRNAEWEAAQKAGGLAKRQLHSAAGMSRFNGPGGHYVHHQRAQSSPEMPQFEFRRGMSRFGSSSTMADVFEEEEEEEDLDRVKGSGASTPQAEFRDSETSSVSGFFSARVSAEKISDSDATPVAKYKSSDHEDSNKPHRSASMKSRTSLASLQEQVIEEEPSPSCPSFRMVEFGRAAQQNLMIAPDSPMASPVSPKMPLESSSSHTTASSLVPVSPYSTTASSSFPSPRSPHLYDGNIISTAPSSVTDDSFQSLLMGEPGPEVRKSLDVPSLASSHSTQPRENFFAQQAAQLNRPLAPGERPASFSLMTFGGRRGSLASLGRLISSSHGERSKLSLEVSPSSDGETNSPKGSKSKRRLSRMVQFWKPKEKKET